MKNRNLTWLIVAVAVVGVLAFVLLNRALHPAVPGVQPGAGPGSSSVPSAGTPGAGPATTQPVRFETGNSADGKQSIRVFRLRPDQALATVNGVRITLKDLVPVRPGDAATEQKMSEETYQFLLQRAVERELTVQAARAQGIDLTDAQQQQLTKTRAARERSEPGVIAQITKDAAQLDFEQRDSQAFMLQTALMVQAGATPYVTEEMVQQYYQDHAAEFGELPADPSARAAAWREIDYNIRQQQTPLVQAEYQRRLTEYLDQLKAKAQIDVAPAEANASAPAAPPAAASAAR